MNNLNIDIKKSFDCRTIVIEDISLYDDINKIDNIILEVKPPGTSCFVSFELYKNWKNKVLNCSLLKICCEDCPSSFSALPDGVYDLKYSINPNLKTIVEFSHLRTCQLEKRFMQVLCNFYSNRCEYSKIEQEEKIEELFEIFFNIESAKWMVEECGNIEKGLDLYNDVNNQLDKYEKRCGCSNI
jgi:hypothetical protein